MLSGLHFLTHAGLSWIVAALARRSRRDRWLAAAIAGGRVYLERHYVPDVLAGAFIGLVVATSLLRRREALAAWLREPLAPVSAD